MPGGIALEYPELYLFPSGLWITVQLAALSLLGSLALGTLVAVLRVAPITPLRWIGGGYVGVFRNTPLLV